VAAEVKALSLVINWKGFDVKETWFDHGTFTVLGKRTLKAYSRINSTKSAASGAGNVSVPRLMSEVGRVRELVCA